MSSDHSLGAQPLLGLAILIIDTHPTFAHDSVITLRKYGAIDAEVVRSATQARRRLVSPPVPNVVLLRDPLPGPVSSHDLVCWICGQAHLQRVIRIAFGESIERPLVFQTIGGTFHARVALTLTPDALAYTIASITRRHMR
jgi:hypothetical protein